LRRASRQPLLVNATGQAIPFAKEAFSEVVATFPSEYIAELATLREAWRVLKPGGKMIILPAAWIAGRGWIDRVAAWLFRATRQAPDWGEVQHLSGWAANLEGPARRAGFRVKVERRDLPSSTLLVICAEKV
jgi:ubiquinone/menaquinone biosynthesis C-methylase UbiE